MPRLVLMPVMCALSLGCPSAPAEPPTPYVAPVPTHAHLLVGIDFSAPSASVLAAHRARGPVEPVSVDRVPFGGGTLIVRRYAPEPFASLGDFSLYAGLVGPSATPINLDAWLEGSVEGTRLPRACTQGDMMHAAETLPWLSASTRHAMLFHSTSDPFTHNPPASSLRLFTAYDAGFVSVQME